MKKFCVLPLLAALAVFVSCQKQQTEEERKAEVERQVQERLAAQRLDEERERLAKQKAELEAREQALANQQAVALASPTPVEEIAPEPERRQVTERTETRTEQRSTASYGMFYEKLEPHGEWRETDDYGYVWQPREAENARDWRPYTEGRWAYSDAGWTWISDEPYGWATYHYGRWVKLRRIGWVWVPGDEWAPAWVSWRTSKDYVGWAPLPPEARFDRRSGIQNWADNYYDIGPEQYCFVSSNDFGAEHVRRAVVPAERNITIVIDTTNVTRITFANTTIVNEGPSYDELRSRSHRPIERYRLRRERNMEGPARVTGAELQVSVPVLTEVRNFFRPRRVKERVTDVNVDNGWTEIRDRSAAERVRNKFRTEATPPPNAPPKKYVKPVEAQPSATPAATTTPAPAVVSPTAAAASPTPAASSPSPSVAKASPTPAASSPSPSIAKASPTPVASASAAASPTPPIASPSPSPRVRPSGTPRLRPSPTIAPSAAPSASVATTPAPATDASPSVAATSPPAASITPPVRVRPSPTMPPRQVHTPLPVIRKSPPTLPGTTPPPTTNPAGTIDPAAAPESATTPVPKPTFTPPVRRPNVPPRAPLPTATPGENTTSDPAQPATPPVRRPNVPPRVPLPTATPGETTTSDAARPMAPRDIPRRNVPPMMTPQPGITAAPPAPVAPNEPPKDRRRHLPPVPGATPAGTASPSPSPTAAPQ